MQKSVRYNEGHALYLSVIARKEGTKRGFLSKKTTENSKWHEKFFALYQNVLFYFDTDQSARPSGIYLLEGCTCERVPALKVSTVGKDTLDKLVSSTFLQHISTNYGGLVTTRRFELTQRKSKRMVVLKRIKTICYICIFNVSLKTKV